MDDSLFEFAIVEPIQTAIVQPVKKKKPWGSIVVLFIIVFMSVFAPLLTSYDPKFMDTTVCNLAPNSKYIFGTDTLGRDIFSCILYGGRISLFIGLFSTVISTMIAIVYGTIAGLASENTDSIMMRFTDIILSVPSILMIIFVQALFRNNNVMTLSIAIGCTSWCSIAKIVRSEVQQIKNSDYILASKMMGASKYYMMIHHLVPNFLSSIMFMIVMNVRSAIMSESTLSFIGLGLPLEVISWGSMLSLGESALLTSSWWVIVFPGLFVVTLIFCITNIGESLKKSTSSKESNL